MAPKFFIAKTNRWTISAICLVVIVTVFSVVYWKRSVRIRAIDGAVTQAAVLEVIPIGSSVEFAKDLMETDGFHCHMEYNRRYTGDDPAGARGQIEHPPADFLYCDTGESFPKRSQVIFIVKDEAVASVAVGVRLL